MKQTVTQDYQALRAAAFVRKEEQLDAIWKIVGALVDQASPAQLAKIPAEALATLDQIKAVKAKFPKPESTGKQPR